jgi:calcium permeable stress-gated cation channel
MSDITNILNGTINGAAGTAQGRQGTTIYTFAISLATGVVLFSVQFTIFLIIRNYLWAKRIYQPRSFLVPVKQRLKPPHNNPFKWLSTVFKIHEDPEVIQKAGMDAYFFLRYLSMCLKIFTPMAVIIIPVLLPLNYRDGKGTRTIDGVPNNITGLDTLAWPNVSPENTDRYWAHLILAIGVIIWVCFVFHQELTHYIAKRQEFLSSPAHRLKASSTTVLIQDIPGKLCNEEALEEMYGEFPGGIRRIWINRDFTALVKKDKLRKDFEDKLENAETDMLRKAVKQSRKAKRSQKEAPTETTNGGQIRANLPSLEDPIAPPAAELGSATPEMCQRDLEHDIKTGATWTKYLTPKQRSTMRIPNGGHTAAARIPLVGRFFSTKVDAIYYCRRELARLNKEIEDDVEISESYPTNKSAFIQFNSQLAAQLACQSVAHTTPKYMRRRFVEISPGDINWASLNLSWRERYFRLVVFLFFFCTLVFAFGLISFFTGILSKASSLAQTTSWLHWVGNLPTWFLSFIQGTLPPVIQVIVLSGPLPILLRMLTNRTRGATTGSEGERSLQLWYFIFLIIELLIIPTVSSGLTSIIQELIHQPTGIPNILANDLPTASNYYYSFLIVQALSLSATSILQTIRLFKYYVIGHVNTPDSVFEKLSWTNLTRIGSNLPWYTTFAVIGEKYTLLSTIHFYSVFLTLAIGLVYAVVAPLMSLFMLITFGLFWVVIKNNVLYCVRTGVVDGAGLFFPSAINQLFIGLYLMQICLVGLFFLVRDTRDKIACDVQGVIMAVVLVFTFLYHIWLFNHLGPLFKYAPVRLEVESQALMADYEAKRSTETGGGQTATDATKSDLTELEKDASTLRLESTAVNQEPDNAQRPELLPERHRPSFRHRPSNAASHRSQDIQAQQREDVKSAKHILARINRPLNEARLAQLETKLAQSEARIGNVLLPRRRDIEAQMMDDPISKIIMQHNDELENLDPEERDMLISVAFTHPVLREIRPSVWIPTDDLGISDDEVRRTREFSKDVAIDNRGAYFDRKLKVQVDKPPPDMSEFALILNEL